MPKYTDKTEYDIVKITGKTSVYTLADGGTHEANEELDPANGKSVILQTGEIINDSEIDSKFNPL